MAAGAALSIAGMASGATIGLKLGINGSGGLQSGVTGALAPTDSAGPAPYTQANWNVLGVRGDNVSTNVFNIVDSSGANTGITINWDASGNWSVQGSATPADQGTPDGNLMNGYIDSNGAGNTTLSNTVYSNPVANKPLVYLSGIQAWLAGQGVSYYDLVLYMDGDNATGRAGEYWLVNASGPITGFTTNGDMTTHVFMRDYNNFTANPTYTRVPFTANLNRVAGVGNYTVFTGLSADSLLVRTAEFNTRCGINAIQIVPRASGGGATIDPLPDARVYAGRNAAFRANVAGVLPFTFQWQKNGGNLSDGGNIFGSTTANLIISNVSGADVASYTLVVSNASGMATSSVAPLTLVAPAPDSYAEKVSTNGAYAYWRLNENGDPSTNYTAAHDYIGGFSGIYGAGAQNGYNGILGPGPSAFPGFEGGNSALQSVNTAVNAALNPSYVSWVVAPPLNLNTNTVTMCAWIYPTVVNEANATGILFTRGGGSDIHGFGYGPGNQLGYTWTNGGATFGFISGLIIPSNQWSFVALAVNATNASLYLFNTNTLAFTNNPIPHPSAPFAGATMIGDDPSSTGTPQNRAFTGIIDEVSVFNRTLNANELLTLYKKGVGLAAIPPTVSSPPLPLRMFAGRTAKFTVSASGEPPLSYVWRKAGNNLSNGGNISGATSPTLTVTGVALADDADFDVVVANFSGSITSSPAHLTVVVSNSAPVAYEAAVRAANPIAYWRLNETNGLLAYDYWGGNIATHTNVALGTAGPQPADFVGFETTNVAAQYDFLNTSATESGVSLMNNRSQFSIIGWFNSPGTQPARTGLFGQNDTAEFGFHANGDLGIFTPNGGFAFMPQSVITANQWYFIAGVGTGTNLFIYLFTTNSIIQTNVAVTTTNYGNSVYPFRIGGNGILDASGNFFTGLIDEVAVFDRALSLGELSGMFGAALSGGPLAPVITVQPNSATLYAGRTAQFPVRVAGSTPLTYTWRRNGSPISNGGNVSGTATDTLTITGVNAGNAGNYDLIAANGSGSVTSLVATLTVIAPSPGSFEAITIANNPLAYWRLNETSGTIAYDYWGGRNGTYQTAALIGVPGPVNPPFIGFESTNTAMQTAIATPSSYAAVPFGTIGTNTFTFTSWLFPIGLQESWSGLLVNRGGGIAGGFNYNDQQMLSYTWNNNNANTYGFISNLLIPTNQWSFVAVVISPTNAILYLINGTTVQTATNAIPHTSDVFGNNWQIGHDDLNSNNNGVRTYNGIIDEVAIYMRSLSRTEILQLFSAGVDSITPLTIQQLGTAVVLSWPRGTLQQADFVNGPYANVVGATSPYTNAIGGGQKYYRVLVK